MRGGLARDVLALWGLACAILIAVSWPSIQTLAMADPDDSMRLLQVRDLIAGQSWWDVAQHRLDGVDGVFAMHWSRLVDLPLAAGMLVLQPFGGQVALTGAAAIVPLLTLLVLLAAVAILTERLADRGVARIALVLAIVSVPLLQQLRPLRVDHHGWQIACALVAAAALAQVPRRGATIVAGVALAALVTISLEGLPVAAAMLALVLATGAALASWRRPAIVVALTTAGATALFHVATRGPFALDAACDAVAPAYLVALAVALGGGAAVLAAPRLGAIARLSLLAFLAAASAATLRLMAPACLAGPFATLDPLVTTLWYRNVAEGLPVWEQTWADATAQFAFPVVGLIGTIIAAYRTDGTARARWIALALLLGAVTGGACLIVRMAVTANALALPGGAWLTSVLVARVRRRDIRPVLRLAAVAGTATVAMPALAVRLMMPSPAEPASAAQAVAGPAAPPCLAPVALATLAALPTTTLFAPLEITPTLLLRTPHHAVASSYHRNGRALHRVIAAFTETPDRARVRIESTGATLLVACPDGNEMPLYARAAPDGLWARLARGERIAWLVPVETGTRLRAWRIRPLPDVPSRP